MNLNFELPACFDHLRRKLESQRGHAGIKDYIQVLRLIEKYSMRQVSRGIEKALALPYPSPDIVRLYCLPEDSPEAATFCLEGREHLRGIDVGKPNIQGYGALLDHDEAGKQEGVA